MIEELTEALERERRRTRQLEVAQEALLERSARRHELVSRLGHELRTPVTVILGMAQTLSEGTAPEEDRPELLERLVVRANDLARLVQRFEAAVEAGLTEWADVNEVAREVAATERSAAGRGRRRAGHGQPEPPGRLPDLGGAGRERAGLLR